MTYSGGKHKNLIIREKIQICQKLLHFFHLINQLDPRPYKKYAFQKLRDFDI